MENKELQLHLYVSVPSVHLPPLMQMSEVIFVLFFYLPARNTASFLALSWSAVPIFWKPHCIWLMHPDTSFNKSA